MRISKEKKYTIQLILATITLMIGLFAFIAGIFLPPIGIVDTSVLVGYGETLTFVGALLGIDYRYKYKEHLRKHSEDDED